MTLPIGQYCMVYGNTIPNRIIEHFLECEYTGVAVGDMAKDIGISRPKAYQIVDEFLKKGYIVESRIVGRTQLYALNKETPVVKIFIRNFNECLKMVVNEYKTKKDVKVPVIVKSKSVKTIKA